MIEKNGNKMSNEEKAILLGALFHDIGKFEQRGIPLEQRLNHEAYSTSLVQKLFQDETINFIVANHHYSKLQQTKETGIKRILAEIVCEADNLASGERQPDTSIKNQQPLESIFSKIDGIYDKKINPKLFLQDISELHFEKYEFPLIKENYNLEKLEGKYRKWWKVFYDDITKVKKTEIDTIIYTLKKYLWCVPSSSYKTRSDVSLFEHSRITAAIAISLFRFFLEKYDGKIENFKDFQNRVEFRYQLVLADITGIQNFIYNIGHKGAAKALKGRSFFLQQMLDNIAFSILEKLNLPITNLIYSSGGKFYLMIPNTKKCNNKLEAFQKKLEISIFNEYNGALGIVFGKVQLNGKDLEYNSEGKKHPISEKWDKLNSIVDREKKRKMSKNWSYELFEPSTLDGELIKCAYTGLPLIKKEIIAANKTKTEEVKLGENVKFLKHNYNGNVFYQIYDDDVLTDDFISKEQFYSQKIGRELKGKFRSLIYQNVVTEYPVLGINSFQISNETKFQNTFNATDVKQFLINSLKINEIESDVNKGFKFYGGDWRFGDTYEEIVSNGVGIERLGVLRLDVDNLGKIFKDGFGKHATFGRVVQLSSMLDFFFSHYVNKLRTFSWDPALGLNENIKSYKFEVRKMIEIVYSGGDDVFIVGHWSILPDIAIWISKEFKKFTSNNGNFSISAGISIFDDKFPIYKAAFEAGEYEESAKTLERKNIKENIQKKKNGISFLDKNVTLSWNDFYKIRNWVTRFYEWIEIGIGEKKLSKGFITRLYNIYYEYEKGKYKNWAKWRWRAAYSLSRFARQYEENFGEGIREFSAELFLSNNYEQELIRFLYVIANWTDLLTRKKEE